MEELLKRTKALKVEEVADLLNVSASQVYKMAARNGIGGVFKVGASLRFEPRAFAAWMQKKMPPTSGGK
jgi:excisionase family DNA binding protein